MASIVTGAPDSSAKDSSPFPLGVLDRGAALSIAGNGLTVTAAGGGTTAAARHRGGRRSGPREHDGQARKLSFALHVAGAFHALPRSNTSRRVPGSGWPVRTPAIRPFGPGRRRPGASPGLGEVDDQAIRVGEGEYL
jgi:hypothetical protein